jgi:transmembrane sensor
MIRIHSGAISDAMRAECDAWRTQTPAHARAYRDAELLWQDVGHVRSHSSSHTDDRLQQVPGRITWIIAASLLLFIGASLTKPVREWISVATADYHTGVGEQRTVALEDGSIIQLNTDTAVNVVFSDGRRELELLKGEAAFTVVTDLHRPFTVHSGVFRARALGTAFSVRHHQDTTTVTVMEHSVQVTLSPSKNVPLIVHEGEQVLFAPAQGLSGARRVDLGMETAWQRGKLIFQNKPLAEVVAELNRYRHGHILILNPALRHLNVTGLFDTATPDVALRIIHQTLQSTKPPSRPIWFFFTDRPLDGPHRSPVRAHFVDHCISDRIFHACPIFITSFFTPSVFT